MAPSTAMSLLARTDQVGNVDIHVAVPSKEAVLLLQQPLLLPGAGHCVALQCDAEMPLRSTVRIGRSSALCFECSCHLGRCRRRTCKAPAAHNWIQTASAAHPTQPQSRVEPRAASCRLTLRLLRAEEPCPSTGDAVAAGGCSGSERRHLPGARGHHNGCQRRGSVGDQARRASAQGLRRPPLAGVTHPCCCCFFGDVCALHDAFQTAPSP